MAARMVFTSKEGHQPALLSFLLKYDGLEAPKPLAAAFKAFLDDMLVLVCALKGGAKIERKRR
jgi:hypothetical protein